MCAVQKPGTPYDSGQDMDLAGEFREYRREVAAGMKTLHDRLDAQLNKCSEHWQLSTKLTTRQDRVIADLGHLEERTAKGLQEIRERQAVSEQAASEVAEAAALKVVEELKGRGAVKVLGWVVAALVAAISAIWAYIKSGGKLPVNP